MPLAEDARRRGRRRGRARRRRRHEHRRTRRASSRRPSRSSPRSSPRGTGTAVAPLPVGGASLDDHDGLTILSTDLAEIREQLPSWASDELPGPFRTPAVASRRPRAWCCRPGSSCRSTVPCCSGRAPQVARVTNRELPRLITVPSPQQDISRTHAEVRVEGDARRSSRTCDSTNGIHVCPARRGRPTAAPGGAQRGRCRRGRRPRRRRDVLGGAGFVTARREAVDAAAPAGLRVPSGSLGLGGFADVFLYQQELPRREVAVKVLLAGQPRRRACARRFQQRGQPHGPAVAPPVDRHDLPRRRSPPTGARSWSWSTARGRVWRSGTGTERISVAEALRIGIRLASARRDRAPRRHPAPRHQAGERADHRLRVAGAHRLRHRRDDAATARGATVGMSIPWSPPELLGEHPTGDERSDVYSLAATIYSLLAGPDAVRDRRRAEHRAAAGRPDRTGTAAADGARRRAAEPAGAARARHGEAPGAPVRLRCGRRPRAAAGRGRPPAADHPARPHGRARRRARDQVRRRRRPDEDREDATRLRSIVTVAPTAPVAPRPPRRRRVRTSRPACAG